MDVEESRYIPQAFNTADTRLKPTQLTATEILNMSNDPYHRVMYVKPGYTFIFDILKRAMERVQTGKGHERHSQDAPDDFLNQDMMTIAREEGIGYLRGQLKKKLREAGRIQDMHRSINEYLDCIIYVVGIILLKEETERQDVEEENGR